MASINKFSMSGYECRKLVDTSTGIRLQYSIKIDKFTERQWLAAHSEVMRSISPVDRQNITSRKLKEIVTAWLQTPRDRKASARHTGIKLQEIEAKGEENFCKGVPNEARWQD